ncbi:MAG TPA: helix-turn-helix transcriptional regulator [Nevskiales bacterium]|nr:helix-turn-helix transcriptional regulator [Nevskiales bacterium]
MGRQEQPDQSESIYQLYEHAALHGPAQYRGLAAELCGKRLAFDALFWGILHHETPVPTSLWRLRVRNSFLAELEPPDWQAFEQALFEDATSEGGARLASLNIARGGLGRLATLRAHFREAGVAQLLAVRSPHPGRPMQSLILFLRREGRPAFGADELATIGPVAPHLGGGLTLALRGLANIDHLLQSLGRPSRHSTGVLDDRGMLLEADDRFRALLHTHFPDWRGGHLPFPLPPLDRSGTEEPVVAGLHVRGSRSEGMTVVHLREVNPMDLLSPRERDVVRAIASGLTLKSIGKRLDISPSTVANHAARIYAKLGIHSRDRLVEMLRLFNRRGADAQQGQDDKAS